MVSSGPTPDVTLDDIRGYVDRERPSTPFGADDVAEALDCPPETADHYLTRLADRGELLTTEIDGAHPVWWTPPERIVDEHEGQARRRPDHQQTSRSERQATHQIDEQPIHGADGRSRTAEEVLGRIDDAVYALDEEFRLTFVNEGAERYFDASAAELLGRIPWEALEFDDEDPVIEACRTAMTAQEPTTVEHYSNQLGIWALVRVHPSDSGLTVHLREISERKEREQELERARDLLERTERVADVGGWEIDPDTRRVFWTDHLSEVLGVPAGVTQPLADVLDVFHEEDRPDLESAVETALDDGEPFDVEARFRTLDGDVRWLTIQGNPEMRAGTVVSLRGAVQDVTERKERERELRRVQDRMEFALNATDAVVWDWNVDEDEASFYPSEESLYGTSVENWEDFVDIIHPEDRDQAQAAIQQSLETGEPKSEEIRIRQNGDVRWIEAPGHPVEDEDGSTRMVGVARDITERKTYERKLKESNERLEQFAHGVSHDLREPLRTVSSYLQLIEERYADELDEDGEEFIEFAVDGADRMQTMIESLLEYSRVESGGDPFEPVDLDLVLQDVLADHRLQIDEHDAEIGVDELPTVEGDASQLRQLFQNLVENAIVYSGDAPPRVHVAATRDDGEWIVSVSDEGIGIDPADQDRVFDVFERLDRLEGQPGTGIGLALCKRIVDRHGGEIWVDSEPGDGTTFSMTFPADESS